MSISLNRAVSRIKTELEDPGEEVDVARGRFESALNDLFGKDDNSESENGSDSDLKEKVMQDATEPGVPNPRSNSILPTRQVRKRRRKETEMRDSSFHHTFVMRLFDRSVDLAQFEESSPLYPICRAWMLNRPHNTELNVKQEPVNSFSMANFEEIENESIQDQISQITSLPAPEPWPEMSRISSHNPRIPAPFQCNGKTLNRVDEESHVAPALLLTQHLHRWRTIRNHWKAVSQQADTRYHKSYAILKAMFERENEKAEI